MAAVNDADVYIEIIEGNIRARQINASNTVFVDLEINLGSGNNLYENATYVANAQDLAFGLSCIEVPEEFNVLITPGDSRVELVIYDWQTNNSFDAVAIPWRRVRSGPNTSPPVISHEFAWVVESADLQTAHRRLTQAGAKHVSVVEEYNYDDVLDLHADNEYRGGGGTRWLRPPARRDETSAENRERAKRCYGREPVAIPFDVGCLGVLQYIPDIAGRARVRYEERKPLLVSANGRNARVSCWVKPLVTAQKQ